MGMTIEGEGRGVLYASLQEAEDQGKEGAMFLRKPVAEADAESVSFELSLIVGSDSPVVFSRQTKRMFVLSWQEIIEMAIEKGIEKIGSERRTLV